MNFQGGNPYRQAAINAAKRKKEEAEYRRLDNLKTDEEKHEDEKRNRREALASNHDTHAMQYSFYSKKF